MVTFLLAASMVVGQTEPADSPVYPHLKALECFEGEWEATGTLPEGEAPSEQLGDVAGKKVRLFISAKWASGKCALIVNFRYELEGVVLILGTAVRAWDQESKEICQHLFTTHKGTWHGTWKQDGTTWINEYEGLDLDGAKCVGTDVITFEGKDHYVWKQTKRTVNGEPQPNIVFHCKRKK